MKPSVNVSSSWLTLASSLLLLTGWSCTALNDEGGWGVKTYNGWSAFEVVTQGDKWDGYRVPGQFDGIGVSS